MTGAQNIDISGNVGKNLVIGDHNLLIEVSGSLVFNAAESAKRQQRDLRKMLRVLVVLAGPVFDPRDPERDPTPLDLLAEWQRLSDAVRASGAPIALIRLAPPTLDSLRYALSPRAVEQGLYPHVLHFGGHAWKNGLLFEDEYGGEDPVITPRLLAARSRASRLSTWPFSTPATAPKMPCLPRKPSARRGWPAPPSATPTRFATTRPPGFRPACTPNWRRAGFLWVILSNAPRTWSAPTPRNYLAMKACAWLPSKPVSH
jgi:hypothetical protein